MGEGGVGGGYSRGDIYAVRKAGKRTCPDGVAASNFRRAARGYFIGLGEQYRSGGRGKTRVWPPVSVDGRKEALRRGRGNTRAGQ